MHSFLIKVEKFILFSFILSLFIPGLCFSKLITPGDFGPSAEIIGFDNLANGAPVTFQLTMQGTYLESESGAYIHVVDAAGMGENLPKSAPYAVTTTSKNTPLVMQFDTPRSKVGLYLGNLDIEVNAVLRAYDIDDKLVDEVTVNVPPGSATDVNTFIGLGIDTAIIKRVTFAYTNIQAAKTIDDLMLEPSQDDNVSVEPYRTTLLSPTAEKQQKLDAINALQLLPSTNASLALQEAALKDSDLYVRERAINALEQLRDPNAIPKLVDIGLTPPSRELMTMTHNTVWALRQHFPMPDAPTITVAAISPIQQGLEFDVEATIISPVDRGNVKMRFGAGELLDAVTTGKFNVYSGPLVAGVPVVLRTRFLARDPGQMKLPFTARISLNKVDATTYKVPLYIDIQAAGGSASMTPFPGWDKVIDHILPINN